jgi:Carbohydrate-binding family 9
MISKAPAGPDDASKFWRTLPSVEIGHFLPQSSDHRPQTRARLCHDLQGIHGRFEVEDRFVRCVRTEYGSEVWKDSCAEFFVEPKPGRGYFNFEFNCGGAFLVNHILDPTRTVDGFKKFVRIPESVASSVRVLSSLPPSIEPEIAEAVAWTLAFRIPFALLEQYVGPLGEIAGQTWRGNFFKCAEENSHPHWAAWSPVDEFNFHRPDCFGELRFA